ncbi:MULTISPECIES: response regulator transcription factor [unclassified Fusibacter]|uniref:response regulator transcription factor n=1 Tax=unclassified Fusibacter TaxID=2624464 RepID=UPI0010116DE2|nr:MULTISPECIES: response regulator transcription factor [unclassified Fusibacter]MCK8061600.1 response regulator transcription factor [Fusibacter sp. A2]NPE23783.1 response regulator transcription factor [Fusibacter sp. A1]RXV58688.1 DNA-binding response regulator [Fusibacter sp. A1]
MKTVLVVEDEQKINAIIVDYLKDAGFKTFSAFDGEQALDLFESEKIDLVILDIMIPKIDGWSVCRRIRKQSGVPVIILTARADEDDKLLGFELGADEYVTKPFSPKVLVARVARLIARITETTVKLGYLTHGPIIINLDAHLIVVDDEEIEMTPKEFDLMVYLIENKGLVLSREAILNKVWGYDFYGELRVVDSHIKKIRKKLGSHGEMIKTVIKVGYRLE